MKGSIILIFSLASALFTEAEMLPRTVTYYVSVHGKDSNPGTRKLPWATIDRVNAEMWKLHAGDTIAFACGETFRFSGKPLEISANGITLTSYGSGEKPVLNCFRVLNNPERQGNGIFSYPVHNQVFQVFQDGQYLIPSRWPDQRDDTQPGPVNGSTSYSMIDEIGIDAINPGARLHYKSYDWDLIHTTITRYSENPRGADTLWWEPVTSTGQSSDHGYYITGITSQINDPGEWSYDASANKLFIKLLHEDTTATIEATFQDIALLIRGEGITIRDIEIRGASESAIEIRSDEKNFMIENVNFLYNDCYGVYAASGNPDRVVIRHCRFHYSWGRPIRIYKASNVTILDNHFYVVGTDKPGGDIYGNGGANQGRGSAIQAELVQGFRVENNRFEKLGANAVFLCGSHYKGRVVRNNYITDFHLLNSDGAAIYMDGTASGDQSVYDTIQGNTMVRGFGSFKGFNQARRDRLAHPYISGIYMDETSGPGGGVSQKCYIWENDIEGTRTGILLHKVKQVEIKKNSIRHVISGLVISDDPGDSIAIFYNQFENVSDVPFECIDRNDREVPLPLSSDFNVLVSTSASLPEKVRYVRRASSGATREYNLGQWRYFTNHALDMHSVVIHPSGKE